MVIFGGHCGLVVKDDVWALSLSGPIPEWSQIVPENLTLFRANHTAIYDPGRDAMLMFGGDDGNGKLDEAWLLYLGEHPVWQHITPDPPRPAPRSHHSAVYDAQRDRMIIFGGTNESGTLNDAWALSLPGLPSWVAVPTGADSPYMLAHSAILDPVRDRMVVYGGYKRDGNPDNQIWALSLSAPPSWEMIRPSGESLSRARHVAIYDPIGDAMIVHGGWLNGDTQKLAFGDTPMWYPLWIWPPSSEGVAASTYDSRRNRLLVNLAFSSGTQMWALDLDSDLPKWTQVLAAPGFHPPYAAAPIYDSARDRMVIFGGNETNEVWALSLPDHVAWERIMPEGPVPAGRSGAAAVYDPLRDRMVVMTGIGPSVYAGPCSPPFSLSVPTYPADTWALSLGTSPSWGFLANDLRIYGPSAVYDPIRDCVVLFGGQYRTNFCGAGYEVPPGVELQSFNWIWRLSLNESSTWSQLPIPEPIPSARGFSSMVYEPNGDRIVLFGGVRHSGRSDRGIEHVYYNDVWELPLADPTSWTQLFPDGTPPEPREHAAVAFDATRNRLWLFGGGTPNGALNDLWSLSWDRTTPALASVAHSSAQADSVFIVWAVSGSSGIPVSVYRNDGGDWTLLHRIVPDPSGHLSLSDRDVVPGERYGYRLGLNEGSREVLAGELWIDVPARPGLAVLGAAPNPAIHDLVVSFSLPDAKPATIEVFDVSGRRMLRRDVGLMGPGLHAVDFSSDCHLPLGVYVVRLTHGSRRVTKRAILLD